VWYRRIVGAWRRLAVLAMLEVGRVLIASPSARADAGATDAQQLFEQARELMDQGRYPEACAKLESSEALDPGIGTEFNLARCYELEGRLASARAMYRRVVEETHAAGQGDRETVARDLSAQLQRRVPRLVLHVTSPAPALEIRLDDAPVTGTDWATPVELDPGPHALEASAPTFLTWKTLLHATREGETVSVDVPPLVPRAALAPVVAPAPSEPRGTVAPDVQPRAGAQRIVALVLGAAALAGMVPGAYFGTQAVALESQAGPGCPDGCNTTGYSERQRSLSAGNLSTAFFVVSGALLGAAGIVWFTAPSR
jgi:hypothetical protein